MRGYAGQQGKGYNMVAIVLLILLANLFAGSIESSLMETFSNQEWIDTKGWEGKI